MKSTCVVRVDSGIAIGIGHVSRCLAIAEALRGRGCTVHFICREHEGAALDWIASKQFVLHRLPLSAVSGEPGPYAAWLGGDWKQDAEQTVRIITALGGADWLVVDHYGIDTRWETVVGRLADRMLVIDDLADRSHQCTLLLDQNVLAGDPYLGLVPPAAEVLLGPRYALLRQEFKDARRQAAVRSGEVRQVLVFFGGSDPTGETLKAMPAIRNLERRGIATDVIVGSSNPRKDEIQSLVTPLEHVRYHCQVTDMARFLRQTDLAMGAAGVSSWERLSLGVPSMVVAVADNQAGIMRQLDERGLVIGLGESRDVTAEDIVKALQMLLDRPDRLRDMSRKAWDLVDGNGVERVAERMIPAQ